MDNGKLVLPLHYVLVIGKMLYLKVTRAVNF